jgi:hypothetical protein
MTSEGGGKIPTLNTEHTFAGEGQQSDQPQVPGFHRHRQHQHRRENRILRFLRDYPETLWGVMAALGLFLVVERLNIRRSLARHAVTASMTAADALGHLADALNRLALSDLLGLLLLMAAAAAMVYRVRWRAMHTTSLTAIRCPRCGGEVHRVHRRTADRIISWIVPVRRYRCSNRECRWEGRRVSTAGRGHRPSSAGR